MALTEKNVLEALKKNGVGSLDDLAKKIAEQSAAKAVFDKVRGVTDKDAEEYCWSGKNYSLYHPEA
jgi:fructose-bisphosphate aldolase class 1